MRLRPAYYYPKIPQWNECNWIFSAYLIVFCVLSPAAIPSTTIKSNVITLTKYQYISAHAVASVIQILR